MPDASGSRDDEHAAVARDVGDRAPDLGEHTLASGEIDRARLGQPEPRLRAEPHLVAAGRPGQTAHPLRARPQHALACPARPRPPPRRRGLAQCDERHQRPVRRHARAVDAIRARSSPTSTWPIGYSRRLIRFSTLRTTARLCPSGDQSAPRRPGAPRAARLRPAPRGPGCGTRPSVCSAGWAAGRARARRIVRRRAAPPKAHRAPVTPGCRDGSGRAGWAGRPTTRCRRRCGRPARTRAAPRSRGGR